MINFRTLGLAILLCLIPTVTAQGSNIDIMLEYYDNSSFDVDNNGVSEDVIDFTVTKTDFSWTVNESNLCTRWHVVPDKADYSTSLCYGANSCCNLLELVSSEENWNNPFFLSRNLYDSTISNSVGAQIIYADYTKESDNKVEVVFSNFSYLKAEFAPFLSSLSSLEFNITSPDNSSALTSGEALTLSLNIKSSAQASYSLDGSPNITMTVNSTLTDSNLSALLSGNLSHNILSNSKHLAKIYVETSSENLSLEHGFEVSDLTSPVITLTNISNTSVLIETDETANLSYTLNSIPYKASLNSSNAALITLNVSNGLNNLTINVSDMHSNYQIVTYLLNVTIESCQDSVQNFHDGQAEGGVDCGGSCSSCVNLSLSTDKSTYSVNELVYIHVSARKDAAHNITISGPSYFQTLSYNGSTFYIITPTLPGNYSANLSLKYRNLPKETVITNFAVKSPTISNPLSLQIYANDTTTSINDAILFSSTISGNVSSTSLKWDFNNDGIIDSTKPNLNYSFTAPGTYLVNLTASDGTWNATSTINIAVSPLYNITVTVSDKTTFDEMPAVIILNDVHTVSPYKVSLKKGSYKLTANYSGYLNYSSTLSVSKNESVQILLTTNIGPTVSLVSPSDNASIVSTGSGFTFEVNKVPTTCSFYFRNNTVFTSIITSHVNSSPHTFYPDIPNGNSAWRVTCTDRAGNIGSSNVHSFSLQELSVKDAKISDKINTILKAVDTALKQYDELPRKEREAAKSMDYRKVLEKAKFELQRAYRDLFNIEWRRLNDTDEQAFRDSIINRVNIVEGNLTVNITVFRSSEFVSYPQDSAVEEVARYYIRSGSYTNDEIQNYVSKNIALQTGVSVTTKYSDIEFIKYSGVSNRGTLIERRLSYDNISGAVIIESIPKSLAKSVYDMEVFTQFKVIQEDPVIEVKPIDNKYAFFIKESLTPVEIQKAQTIVLQTKVDPFVRKQNKITGLAVVNIEKLSSPAAIISEIIILVLIISSLFFFSRESQGIRSLKSIMQAAFAESDHLKSVEHYSKISELFKGLKAKERASVYPELLQLGDKIRYQKVSAKINEVKILLQHSQFDAAKKLYSQISSAYKSLPPAHRKALFAHCSSIHKKLSQRK